MEKLNAKKVGMFLKNLTGVEYRYLELTMQMVSSMESIIRKYNLDKNEFCKLFEIKLSNYDNYTKGNWNYAVDDMSQLDYVYKKLEKERLENESLIKISAEK
jgi:hypothetical protein